MWVGNSIQFSRVDTFHSHHFDSLTSLGMPIQWNKTYTRRLILFYGAFSVFFSSFLHAVGTYFHTNTHSYIKMWKRATEINECTWDASNIHVYADIWWRLDGVAFCLFIFTPFSHALLMPLNHKTSGEWKIIKVYKQIEIIFFWGIKNAF